eukprot:6190753-Pleurochrysis_carterae.AAC.3
MQPRTALWFHSDGIPIGPWYVSLGMYSSDHPKGIHARPRRFERARCVRRWRLIASRQLHAREPTPRMLVDFDIYLLMAGSSHLKKRTVH